MYGVHFKQECVILKLRPDARVQSCGPCHVGLVLLQKALGRLLWPHLLIPACYECLAQHPQVYVPHCAACQVQCALPHGMSMGCCCIGGLVEMVPCRLSCHT